MNILDYQEVQHVQQQLLSFILPLEYNLNVPTQQEIQLQISFASDISTNIPNSSKELLLKKLSISQYLKHYDMNDPNASFKMVVYCLFASTFPPKCQEMPQTDKNHHNLELLRSLKCTLYSPDINLQQLVNFPLQTQSKTVRAILAKFFKQITEFYLQSNDSKLALTFALKLLQKNNFVEQILVGCFRLVLSKLQIQGVNDFKLPFDANEVIINLIQFFDLNYRHLQEIVLFYEEKMFLLITEKKLLFGLYTQQDSIKEDDIKQNNDNLMFSLNETTQFGIARKKNKVIQQDKQLFSCLLRSSRSEPQKKIEVEPEQETPHFMQNIELVFGRRKKDQNQIQKHQAMKRQFAMLISSQQNLGRGIQEDAKELSSPVSSAEAHIDELTIKNASSKQSRKLSLKRATVEAKRQIQRFLQEKSAIISLSEQTEKIQPSNFSSNKSKLNPIKQSVNLVAIKDKVVPSTPQNIYDYARFRPSIDKDFFFPESPPTRDVHQRMIKRQSMEMQNNENRRRCPCYAYRYSKNIVVSHVLNINFVMKNPGPLMTKNLNMVSQPNIVVHSPRKYKQFKEEKIPTFLKARIERTFNGCSPQYTSIKSPTNNKSVSRPKRRPRPEPCEQFKTLSQIISNQAKQVVQRQKHSRKKSTLSKSKSKKQFLNPTSVIKKYDMEQTNKRLYFGKPSYWQTTSHLIQSPEKNQNQGQYRKTMEQKNRKQYNLSNNNMLGKPVQYYSPECYARSSGSSSNQYSLEKPSNHSTFPQQSKTQPTNAFLQVKDNPKIPRNRTHHNPHTYL